MGKLHYAAIVALAVLILGAATYYVARSWSRRSIVFFGRASLRRVSRDSDPAFYWFAMALYVVATAYAEKSICERLYDVARHGRF